MKTRRWVLVGLIATAILLPAAHAEPPPQAAVEIDYLLGLVGSSGCEFNRNGTWYDSKRAQEHLRYKYEYLATHDQSGDGGRVHRASGHEKQPERPTVPAEVWWRQDRHERGLAARSAGSLSTDRCPLAKQKHHA